MKLEMDFKNYKKCYYLFNRQKLIEYSKNYYIYKKCNGDLGDIEITENMKKFLEHYKKKNNLEQTIKIKKVDTIMDFS